MAKLKDKKYPTLIDSDIISEKGIKYSDCKILFELLLSEVIDGFYERHPYFERSHLHKTLKSLDGLIFLDKVFCKDMKPSINYKFDHFDSEVRAFESVLGCFLNKIFEKRSEVWIQRMQDRIKMLIILKLYSLISEYQLIPIDDEDYSIDVFEKLINVFYKHFSNLYTGNGHINNKLFKRFVNIKNEFHRLDEIRKKLHPTRDFKFDYDKWMKIYRLMIIEISTILGFPDDPDSKTENFRTLDDFLMLKTIRLLLSSSYRIPPECITYGIELSEKILSIKTGGKIQKVIQELNDKQNNSLQEKLRMLIILNHYKFTMEKIDLKNEDKVKILTAAISKIEKDLKSCAETLYNEYGYDVERILLTKCRGKINLH